MPEERSPNVKVRVDEGVAYVVIDRPEKRNAFDDRVAAALERVFCELAEDDEVRVAVLGALGPVFCSGADLTWMRKVADYTAEENLRDATAFQDAFDAIDRFPKPVIARVQGAALAGASSPASSRRTWCARSASVTRATCSSRARRSAPRMRCAWASCTTSCPRRSSTSPCATSSDS